MELYTRLVKTLNSRGSIVPVGSVADHLNTIKESDVDWYTSLFVYPKDMVDYFNKKQTVADYAGPAYTDTLVWDFDNKDLNLVKEDVRELLRKLSKNLGGPENTLQHVSVWFSGGKGFHVYLKTNRQFSPKEAKHICSTLAIGLKTFDSVVYNATRLFRFRNTKHNKTGLYKILVDPRMLKDSDAIEKITAAATVPGTWEEATTPITDTAFIQDILDSEPIKKSIIVDSEEVDGIRGLDKVDFRKSKSIPKCIYALTHGIMKPGEGERNHIFLHLGNFYRNQGHSKEVVHNLLKAVARQNKQLYPEAEEFSKQEIWNTIIPRVFRDEHINPGGWGVEPGDTVFAKYCKSIPNDCKCSIHDPKESSKVFKIEDLTSDFDSFATNFHDNIVTTGIQFLDRNIKIARATTTLLVGASGCHRKGQGITMADGSVKKVEDIIAGDQVMGPDSKPRNVLKLARGTDEMYKITPEIGSAFYVNGDHILTHSHHGFYFDLTVREILAKPNSLKNRRLLKITDKEDLELSFSIAKESDSEDYYGFTLDKDHLYLLDDGIVTHNCGKTSAMINIMQHTSHEGHLTYFSSADMTKNLLYLKLAQRHCKLTQDEIFNAWKLQDRKIMKQVHDVVKDYYGSVYFDFAGNPTLDDLSQRIKEVEQKEGSKVKLVIVDYASRLRGPYSDVNANEQWNALATKDVAADTDCAWIILNQISRASGDGSTPLRTKRAVKGSSAWEESASNVITMWRPFLDLHEVHDSEHDVVYHDKYIRIMSAKNRMGVTKEEVLHWDGPTGRIWDMTPEERDRYDVEEKRKEKFVQIYRSPMKRQ